MEHTNEGDYIMTCSSFGLKRALVPMARSGYAILDLTSFVRQDKTFQQPKTQTRHGA